MSIESFLAKVRSGERVTFNDTMSVIDANYTFTPTRFSNGEVVNNAGENNGSCKLFAFAKLHGLSAEQTLSCFGEFYFDEVLTDANGDSHQNIRNFMRSGWEQINFDQPALS